MIVIPMAGLSSRFKKAGYSLPKYMLEAHGYTLFHHSIKSFKNYFTSEKFLFIALDVFDTEAFIHDECQKMGIRHFEVVILSKPTKGQAETVFLGLEKSSVPKDEHILIFNIDTFRPNFEWPSYLDIQKIDGYLETFIGSGKNWSNIEPKNKNDYSVKRTAEKQEISEYCCTGLYFFRSFKKYKSLFSSYSKKDLGEVDAGEYYIAPMYNMMIEAGADIRFSVISKDKVIFCGIPEEYEEFKKQSTDEN